MLQVECIYSFVVPWLQGNHWEPRKYIQVPSTSCILCGKPHNRYTHTINWSQQQRDWLRQHSALQVHESACICTTCGDDVKKGVGNSQYKPRWVKPSTSKPATICAIVGCDSQSSRSLKCTDVEPITENGLRFKSHTHRTLAVCASHAMQMYRILNPTVPCKGCGIKPLNGKTSHERSPPNP